MRGGMRKSGSARWVAVLLASTALSLGVAGAGVAAPAAATPGAVAPATATPAGTVTAAAGASPAASAPATAQPYSWSATKSADGGITLSGEIPNEDERQVLLDNIGNLTADKMVTASGEPDGFIANASAALDVLDDLDSGSVSYDGTTWRVVGKASSAEQAKTVRQTFDSSALAAAGASYDVSAPAKPVVAPDVTEAPAPSAVAVPAAVSPDYAWSVEKGRNGLITFNGTVPTDKLKRFLLTEAGAKALDNSTIVAGAPADFNGGALNGLRALEKLRSGRLSFADGRWSLSGIAATTDGPAAVRTALAEIDTSKWQFDIKIAPAAKAGTEPAAAAANSSAAETNVPGSAAAAPPAPKTAAPAVATSAPPVPAVTSTTEAASSAASAAPAASGSEAASSSSAEPAAAPPTVSTPTKSEPPAAASASAPAEPSAAPAPPPTAPAESAPAAPPGVAPETEAPPPVKPEAAAPAYTFTAVKGADGSTTMTGNAPSDRAKSYLGVVASEVNTDGLAVSANAPANFMADALKGLDALSDLETGTLKFDGKAWALTGKATTPAGQAAASAIVAGLPDAASWTTDIKGPPPLALCKQSLEAFNALNQITFVSGTKLASGSSEALDTLATDLAVCPQARVDVEGNTDSDGDANANMALSVARAEAVVAELVKRGVDPTRLYAIGYGETLPLVPNTTAKNKALNRRVAVEVEAPKGK